MASLNSKSFSNSTNPLCAFFFFNIIKKAWEHCLKQLFQLLSFLQISLTLLHSCSSYLLWKNQFTLCLVKHTYMCTFFRRGHTKSFQRSGTQAGQTLLEPCKSGLKLKPSQSIQRRKHGWSLPSEYVLALQTNETKNQKYVLCSFYTLVNTWVS